MFKLLKGGECYAPEPIGKKDILLAFDRIYKVEDNISAGPYEDLTVFDCSNRIVCPGLIDQHVHITGGGGEEGPVSRIPELMLSDIISAGITTLVGVLGVDGITRNIANLLAKARALEAEGITAYIYTGSYSIPTATLTGTVANDIVLIDKVIGVGEIAIADHRSSHPTLQMLKSMASEARTGGLLGGKAGVMHIHVGDGKDGLKLLSELIEDSDFPVSMFVPTHLNRNKVLFMQAVEYAGKGGRIDLTAGETSERGVSVPEALEVLLKTGIDINNITVSSDGNGSIPGNANEGSGVGKAIQLFYDMRDSKLKKNIDTSSIIKIFSTNAAKVLKIYPKKGALLCGSDADILILKKDMSMDKLIARGELLADNGIALKRGRFEERHA